jgi:hypothetical protein
MERWSSGVLENGIDALEGQHSITPILQIAMQTMSLTY